MPSITQNTSCRVCKGEDLSQFFTLGAMPPANAFLKRTELQRPEQTFPLDVYFCNTCSFVQLTDIVSSELLFLDYVYVSSTSPTFVNHFVDLAETVIPFLALKRDSLVVDIGSNDGILLKPFQERGMRVLGVDPAKKIVAIATQNGIPTIPNFFTPKIAREIVKAHGNASLVTATSVFPHVNNLDELMEGIQILLADDGVFLIEAYYLADIIEKTLFDTIYHEHLSYFTATTFQSFFKRLGMSLFHVDHIDTHGGSLRVFVQKQSGSRKKDESISYFVQKEKKQKLNQLKTYLSFADRARKNRVKLVSLLSSLKSQQKRIVGYGAAAKGNTLLNFFGIDSHVVDYIVDDSAWKQGLFAPGSHIPVVSPEHLHKEKPDYILILAWNFAHPIIKKLQHFQLDEVQYIIPVPYPHIIKKPI